MMMYGPSPSYSISSSLRPPPPPSRSSFPSPSPVQIFARYNQLIQSDNYVTKRQSLKLLGEILLDRKNYTVMIRYINDPDNLKVMMNLLRGKSKTIQFEAFHVFKVFVRMEMGWGWYLMNDGDGDDGCWVLMECCVCVFFCRCL